MGFIEMATLKCIQKASLWRLPNFCPIFNFPHTAKALPLFPLPSYLTPLPSKL